jgi:hypothetical protein
VLAHPVALMGPPNPPGIEREMSPADSWSVNWADYATPPVPRLCSFRRSRISYSHSWFWIGMAPSHILARKVLTCKGGLPFLALPQFAVCSNFHAMSAKRDAWTAVSRGIGIRCLNR